nr:reverse transcriptase domain-containing protein [Tanacetum cinerariifolium]
MWGNNRAIVTTPRSAIIAVDLGDNFTIKGHRLLTIKDRQFDGRARADPDMHIAEFVKISEMFRFFPQAMVDRLMGEIQGFTQHPHESLVDSWLCMKDLLRNCFGHGLSRGTIIQIFYHGLDKATEAILDAGGIFIYKTPNNALQLLEDRVLLKLNFSKDINDKPLRKTVAFAEVVKDHTPRRSVMKNPWEDPKKKKQTMPTEDIEEEDIEETTTKTYDPPINPNAKNTIINDDDEDEADKTKKEEVPSSSQQTETNPPLLKLALLHILAFREAHRAVLKDSIPSTPTQRKDGRAKFLKDLVSNKSKMEQISAAFINEECSAIVQNKLPPKLEEELDAFIDNSKPFLSTSKKINETSLDKEFEEFMAVDIKEISKQKEEVKDNFRNYLLRKI